MTLKLNLGCGADIRTDYVNVDIYPGAGIYVWDLNDYPWPWPDESVEHILAENVLDHVASLDVAMREIYRVLIPGGSVHIVVAHRGNGDPFHGHPFDRRSVRFLTNGYAGKFAQVGRTRMRSIGGFPWWHIRAYLGIEPPALPGTNREMTFTLEKVA